MNERQIRDPDGSIGEVVVEGRAHLERLDES